MGILLCLLCGLGAQSTWAQDPPATLNINEWVDNESPASTYDWEYWAAKNSTGYSLIQSQELETGTSNTGT